MRSKGSFCIPTVDQRRTYNIVRNALQMQIQIVMEEAEFVESVRQARQEPYRVRRIERQIRQLTAEKAHTQGIKEKLYGDYADEILTREDFLNYNELYSKRIEEYDHKITEVRPIFAFCRGKIGSLLQLRHVLPNIQCPLRSRTGC